jgi:hypothetical protein
MFLSRGQKLALMSKVNSIPTNLVEDWVDKTCAMVSDFIWHLAKKIKFSIYLSSVVC